MNQKGFVVRPIVVAKAHKPAVFYRRKLTSTPIAVLHTPYASCTHWSIGGVGFCVITEGLMPAKFCAFRVAALHPTFIRVFGALDREDDPVGGDARRGAVCGVR